MSNILTLLISLIYLETFGQVSINNVNPHPSAALDVSSTTMGFLPPRMTAAQRDEISAPAQGLMVFCTDCGPNGEPQFYNGHNWVNMIGGTASMSTSIICGTSSVTFTYNGTTVTYGTVVSANNRCWLDRNLGASQVANSATDTLAYGDLFQWGRGPDGHQIKYSATTPMLSTTDQPGHDDFILASTSPANWRSPENNNLWQGVNATNNPCPPGFRLPTEMEFDIERLSWNSNNSSGAFSSPLKLTMAGARNRSLGYLYEQDIWGHYWTSSTNDDIIHARRMFFNAGDVLFSGNFRADGFSVRCIKD
jgi:uncharacterized protein (TIGR02145 family)